MRRRNPCYFPGYPIYNRVYYSETFEKELDIKSELKVHCLHIKVTDEG